MTSAKKKAVTLATGAALSATLMAAGMVHAAGSPFAMHSLEKGYMVADAGDKMKDGKCAGSDKMQDGKCASSDKGSMDKTKAVPKMKDGNCAGTDQGAGDKMKDGKCGATDKK